MKTPKVHFLQGTEAYTPCGKPKRDVKTTNTIEKVNCKRCLDYMAHKTLVNTPTLDILKIRRTGA